MSSVPSCIMRMSHLSVGHNLWAVFNHLFPAYFFCYCQRLRFIPFIVKNYFTFCSILLFFSVKVHGFHVVRPLQNKSVGHLFACRRHSRPCGRQCQLCCSIKKLAPMSLAFEHVQSQLSLTFSITRMLTSKYLRLGHHLK